jgi:hypothetical protein
VVAWVVSVAQCPEAVELGADQLARFHDKFDVLEQDDVITTRLRMQKREGKPTPAHWDALSTVILDHLQNFARRRAA